MSSCIYSIDDDIKSFITKEKIKDLDLNKSYAFKDHKGMSAFNNYFLLTSYDDEQLAERNLTRDGIIRWVKHSFKLNTSDYKIILSHLKKIITDSIVEENSSPALTEIKKIQHNEKILINKKNTAISIPNIYGAENNSLYIADNKNLHLSNGILNSNYERDTRAGSYALTINIRNYNNNDFTIHDKDTLNNLDKDNNNQTIFVFTANDESSISQTLELVELALSKNVILVFTSDTNISDKSELAGDKKIIEELRKRKDIIELQSEDGDSIIFMTTTKYERIKKEQQNITYNPDLHIEFGKVRKEEKTTTNEEKEIIENQQTTSSDNQQKIKQEDKQEEKVTKINNLDENIRINEEQKRTEINKKKHVIIENINKSKLKVVKFNEKEFTEELNDLNDNEKQLLNLLIYKPQKERNFDIVIIDNYIEKVIDDKGKYRYYIVFRSKITGSYLKNPETNEYLSIHINENIYTRLFSLDNYTIEEEDTDIIFDTVDDETNNNLINRHNIKPLVLGNTIFYPRLIRAFTKNNNNKYEYVYYIVYISKDNAIAQENNTFILLDISNADDSIFIDKIKINKKANITINENIKNKSPQIRIKNIFKDNDNLIFVPINVLIDIPDEYADDEESKKKRLETFDSLDKNEKDKIVKRSSMLLSFGTMYSILTEIILKARTTQVYLQLFKVYINNKEQQIGINEIEESYQNMERLLNEAARALKLYFYTHKSEYFKQYREKYIEIVQNINGTLVDIMQTLPYNQQEFRRLTEKGTKLLLYNLLYDEHLSIDSELGYSINSIDAQLSHKYLHILYELFGSSDTNENLFYDYYLKHTILSEKQAQEQEVTEDLKSSQTYNNLIDKNEVEEMFDNNNESEKNNYYTDITLLQDSGSSAPFIIKMLLSMIPNLHTEQFLEPNSAYNTLLLHIKRNPDKDLTQVLKMLYDEIMLSDSYEEDMVASTLYLIGKNLLSTAFFVEESRGEMDEDFNGDREIANTILFDIIKKDSYFTYEPLINLQINSETQKFEYQFPTNVLIHNIDIEMVKHEIETKKDELSNYIEYIVQRNMLNKNKKNLFDVKKQSLLHALEYFISQYQLTAHRLYNDKEYVNDVYDILAEREGKKFTELSEIEKRKKVKKYIEQNIFKETLFNTFKITYRDVQNFNKDVDIMYAYEDMFIFVDLITNGYATNYYKQLFNKYKWFSNPNLSMSYNVTNFYRDTLLNGKDIHKLNKDEILKMLSLYADDVTAFFFKSKKEYDITQHNPDIQKNIPGWFMNIMTSFISSYTENPVTDLYDPYTTNAEKIKALKHLFTLLLYYGIDNKDIDLDISDVYAIITNNGRNKENIKNIAVFFQIFNREYFNTINMLYKRKNYNNNAMVVYKFVKVIKEFKSYIITYNDVIIKNDSAVGVSLPLITAKQSIDIGLEQLNKNNEDSSYVRIATTPFYNNRIIKIKNTKGTILYNARIGGIFNYEYEKNEKDLNVYEIFITKLISFISNGIIDYMQFGNKRTRRVMLMGDSKNMTQTQYTFNRPRGIISAYMDDIEISEEEFDNMFKIFSKEYPTSAETIEYIIQNIKDNFKKDNKIVINGKTLMNLLIKLLELKHSNNKLIGNVLLDNPSTKGSRIEITSNINTYLVDRHNYVKNFLYDIEHINDLTTFYSFLYNRYVFTEHTTDMFIKEYIYAYTINKILEAEKDGKKIVEEVIVDKNYLDNILNFMKIRRLMFSISDTEYEQEKEILDKLEEKIKNIADIISDDILQSLDEETLNKGNDEIFIAIRNRIREKTIDDIADKDKKVIDITDIKEYVFERTYKNNIAEGYKIFSNDKNMLSLSLHEYIEKLDIDSLIKLASMFNMDITELLKNYQLEKENEIKEAHEVEDLSGYYKESSNGNYIPYPISQIKKDAEKRTNEYKNSIKERLQDALMDRILNIYYIYNMMNRMFINDISMLIGDLGSYDINDNGILKRIMSYVSTGSSLDIPSILLPILKSKFDIDEQDEYLKPLLHENKLNFAVIDDVLITLDKDSTMYNVLSSMRKQKYTDDDQKMIEDMIKKSPTALGNKKMNVTDGSGFIHFSVYRLLMMKANKWDEKQEYYYRKLMNNTLTDEDIRNIIENNYVLFPPFKLQYAGHVHSPIAITANNHKYALYPILPQLYYNDSYISELYEYMEKNGIHYLIPSSSNKISTPEVVNPIAKRKPSSKVIVYKDNKIKLNKTNISHKRGSLDLHFLKVNTPFSSFSKTDIKLNKKVIMFAFNLIERLAIDDSSLKQINKIFKDAGILKDDIDKNTIINEYIKDMGIYIGSKNKEFREKIEKMFNDENFEQYLMDLFNNFDKINDQEKVDMITEFTRLLNESEIAKGSLSAMSRGMEILTFINTLYKRYTEQINRPRIKGLMNVSAPPVLIHNTFNQGVIKDFISTEYEVGDISKKYVYSYDDFKKGQIILKNRYKVGTYFKATFTINGTAVTKVFKVTDRKQYDSKEKEQTENIQHIIEKMNINPEDIYYVYNIEEVNTLDENYVEEIINTYAKLFNNAGFEKIRGDISNDISRSNGLNIEELENKGIEKIYKYLDKILEYYEERNNEEKIDEFANDIHKIIIIMLRKGRYNIVNADNLLANIKILTKQKIENIIEYVQYLKENKNDRDLYLSLLHTPMLTNFLTVNVNNFFNASFNVSKKYTTLSDINIVAIKDKNIITINLEDLLVKGLFFDYNKYSRYVDNYINNTSLSYIFKILNTNVTFIDQSENLEDKYDKEDIKEVYFDNDKEHPIIRYVITPDGIEVQMDESQIQKYKKITRKEAIKIKGIKELLIATALSAIYNNNLTLFLNLAREKYGENFNFENQEHQYEVLKELINDAKDIIENDTKENKTLVNIIHEILRRVFEVIKNVIKGDKKLLTFVNDLISKYNKTEKSVDILASNIPKEMSLDILTTLVTNDIMNVVDKKRGNIVPIDEELSVPLAQETTKKIVPIPFAVTFDQQFLPLLFLKSPIDNKLIFTIERYNEIFTYAGDDINTINRINEFKKYLIEHFPILSNRNPTQSKSYLEVLYVAQFLHPLYSSTSIMPAITLFKEDADFDYDKINHYLLDVVVDVKINTNMLNNMSRTQRIKEIKKIQSLANKISNSKRYKLLGDSEKLNQEELDQINYYLEKGIIQLELRDNPRTHYHNTQLRSMINTFLHPHNYIYFNNLLLPNKIKSILQLYEKVKDKNILSLLSPVHSSNLAHATQVVGDAVGFAVYAQYPMLYNENAKLSKEKLNLILDYLGIDKSNDIIKKDTFMELAISIIISGTVDYLKDDWLISITPLLYKKTLPPFIALMELHFNNYMIKHKYEVSSELGMIYKYLEDEHGLQQLMNFIREIRPNLEMYIEYMNPTFIEKNSQVNNTLNVRIKKLSTLSFFEKLKEKNNKNYFDKLLTTLLKEQDKLINEKKKVEDDLKRSNNKTDNTAQSAYIKRLINEINDINTIINTIKKVIKAENINELVYILKYEHIIMLRDLLKYNQNFVELVNHITRDMMFNEFIEFGDLISQTNMSVINDVLEKKSKNMIVSSNDEEYMSASLDKKFLFMPHGKQHYSVIKEKMENTLPFLAKQLYTETRYEHYFYIFVKFAMIHDTILNIFHDSIPLINRLNALGVIDDNINIDIFKKAIYQYILSIDEKERQEKIKNERLNKIDFTKKEEKLKKHVKEILKTLPNNLYEKFISNYLGKDTDEKINIALNRYIKTMEAIMNNEKLFLSLDVFHSDIANKKYYMFTIMYIMKVILSELTISQYLYNNKQETNMLKDVFLNFKGEDDWKHAYEGILFNPLDNNSVLYFLKGLIDVDSTIMRIFNQYYKIVADHELGRYILTKVNENDIPYEDVVRIRKEFVELFSTIEEKIMKKYNLDSLSDEIRNMLYEIKKSIVLFMLDRKYTLSMFISPDVMNSVVSIEGERLLKRFDKLFDVNDFEFMQGMKGIDKLLYNIGENIKKSLEKKDELIINEEINSNDNEYKPRENIIFANRLNTRRNTFIVYDDHRQEKTTKANEDIDNITITDDGTMGKDTMIQQTIEMLIYDNNIDEQTFAPLLDNILSIWLKEHDVNISRSFLEGFFKINGLLTYDSITEYMDKENKTIKDMNFNDIITYPDNNVDEETKALISSKVKLLFGIFNKRFGYTNPIVDIIALSNDIENVNKQC